MNWYALIIDGKVVLVEKFEDYPAPSEFRGFRWNELPLGSCVKVTAL